VSQEPTLFMTSVFENIAIGKQGELGENVVFGAGFAGGLYRVCLPS
jgi:hypothetical protein